MSFIDANEFPSESRIDTDICIVGAGAAGITIANELDGDSRSVCLIESGGYRPDEETQSLYNFENMGYPIRENFMSRARYFGGTCNLWAGRAMKLSPIDLSVRSWIPYSGWPLTFADLDRYYCRSENILGLPSFERFSNISMLPGVDSKEAALFDDDQLQSVVALWGRRALRFGSAYRSVIKKSVNITTYLNSNVTEILLNDSGSSVVALAATTLGGKRLTVSAKSFVLACGGLENARLLLVSRSCQSGGVGNGYDVVGRYYMDHPRAIVGRVRLHKPSNLPYLAGSPVSDGTVQVGIGLSEDIQRDEQLLNGYVTLEPQLSEFAEKRYETSIDLMKILLRRGYAGNRFRFSRANLSQMREMIYLLTPKEVVPHALYRSYVFLKRNLKKHGSIKNLTIINYCEQAPNPSSRVYLSESRDPLNVNSLVLDWKIGEEEGRVVTRLHELLGKRLQESGVGVLENSAAEAGTLSFTDASHHIGTTRMSEDPKTGVVDKNCKVHGVSNLFIAGSAVFPTAGHANPTLTIVALALRLADHIKARCN